MWPPRETVDTCRYSTRSLLNMHVTFDLLELEEICLSGLEWVGEQVWMATETASSVVCIQLSSVQSIPFQSRPQSSLESSFYIDPVPRHSAEGVGTYLRAYIRGT